MQSLFDKFSLQNIFRQFFCGFVFIASFLFFSEGQKTCFPDGYGCFRSEWWIVVAACIIGTIIYHLEKNLYSYSIQALFEGMEELLQYLSKKGCLTCTLCLLSKVVILCIVFVLILGVFLCFFHYQPITFLILIFLTTLGIPPKSRAILPLAKSSPWIKFGITIVLLSFLVLYLSSYDKFQLFSFDLWLFIYAVAFFIAWPCVSEQVIKRTQEIWLIEGYTKDNGNGNSQTDLSGKKAIAQKLATWSDFIHCTQSCCFAWIAGCWIAKCRIIGCGFADGFCAASKEPSVQGVCIILLLEIFFDWHRYQHVLAITEPKG